jgi:hypothetical protein
MLNYTSMVDMDMDMDFSKADKKSGIPNSKEL